MASAPTPQKYPPEYLAENSSSALLNVAIAFALIESLVVALFVVARMKIKTANGLDFYLILPSYIVCFSQTILCFLFVRYAGIGRHWVAISTAEKIRFIKLEIALSNITAMGLALPKLAILALYVRVFSTRAYRYASFAIAAILLVAMVLSLSLNMAMCIPFAYQWNKTLPHGHCLNQFRIFIWFSIPSIVTDVAIIAIPLPVIWRLKTSAAQKIGLTVTFLTGGVGIFTAIIRFAEFLKLENPALDLSWAGIEVVLWTTVEPGVYLIAACLPSLRVLFNPVLKELDLQSLRTRLREHGCIKTSEEAGSSNVHLSNIPVKIVDSNQSTEQRSSRNPRAGFKRLNEPSWPGRTAAGGNTNPGLVTCYRERDSEDSLGAADSRTQLQRSQYSYGIVVQKAFTIVTEPAVPP